MAIPHDSRESSSSDAFHARRGSETKANDPEDLFLGNKIISAASVLSVNVPSPGSFQNAKLEYP